MSEFRVKFREARLNAGLTMTKVAREMEVTRQTIYNWESNKNEPKLAQVMKLAELYGVDVDELIRGK